MKIKSNLIETHTISVQENKIKYLLMKRSSHEKYPDIWQMVTGKIHEDEEAFTAALRELKEETNLEVEKLFIVPKVNSFYNSDDDSVCLIPVFVALVKYDQVTLSSEHQAYKWVNKKNAKKMLAWPGQSDSVEIIHDFFSKKKENLNFIEIPMNKKK